MRIEVCIDAQPAAEAALADGADRLEVCARLDLDGLSPDPELLRQLRAATERPLFAMVRPRPGDFVLQDGEPDAMRRDLEQALELGADGVVIGCLTAQGEIPDQELGWVLDALPQGFPRTFHRAFESALDPAASLARIAGLGFDRVLGSGRPGKVVDHLPYLTELVAFGRAVQWALRDVDARGKPICIRHASRYALNVAMGCLLEGVVVLQVLAGPTESHALSRCM